jgi:hypothetical protein
VMDALTERLHEAAEALPSAMPAPGQLRQRAERARRIRRAAVGSAAAGVLVVLALGVGVLGGGARPQLAPAGPASRAWASPVGSVFTEDPVMPEAGWGAIMNGNYGALRNLDAPGGQSLKVDGDLVIEAKQPRPLACITDPYTLGAEETHGATVLQPGSKVDAVPLSGRWNEYVLWFANPSDAGRALARLREEFQECRFRPDPTYRIDSSYLAYDEVLIPPVDEQLSGEIEQVPTNGTGDGYGYRLSVARQGRLVVVHESLEAWWDRPDLTVFALTTYAVDRLSPTVAP